MSDRSEAGTSPDSVAGAAATVRWMAALGRTLRHLPICDPVVLFVLEGPGDRGGGASLKPPRTEVFPLLLRASELLAHEDLPPDVHDFVAGAPSQSGIVRCVVKSGTSWSSMPMPLDPALLGKLLGADEGAGR